MNITPQFLNSNSYTFKQLLYLIHRKLRVNTHKRDVENLQIESKKR